MNILVVEDNRVAAQFLVKTLARMGHTSQCAENGALAWAMFQSTPFEVVISDWEMPEMDGLQLCRLVRDYSDTLYTYFILLTAKSQVEDKVLGLQAGADDFLVKPLDSGELMARLEVGSRIITMHKQMANMVSSLHAAQQRFSELFLGLPIAGVTIDEMGRVQEWNRAFESLINLQGKMIYEESLLDTITPLEMRPELEIEIGELLEGKHISDYEWHFKEKGSIERYLLWNAIPLTSFNGTITGAIHTLIDITQMKRTEQQVRQYSEELEGKQKELWRVNALLHQQALTDGLTGLSNHRAFQENLNQEYLRAQRHFTPLAVIMADVDYFKRFNDSFGHPAGDEVLKTVATLIRDTARETDCVARYGGEEFVMVLVNTDAEGAFQVAERIRTAVESFPWAMRPITLSLGVSALRADSKSATEVLGEADFALYRSKQEGRNRVTLHHSSSDGELTSAA